MVWQAAADQLVGAGALLTFGLASACRLLCCRLHGTSLGWASALGLLSQLLSGAAACCWGWCWCWSTCKASIWVIGSGHPADESASSSPPRMPLSCLHPFTCQQLTICRSSCRGCCCVASLLHAPAASPACLVVRTEPARWRALARRSRAPSASLAASCRCSRTPSAWLAASCSCRLAASAWAADRCCCRLPARVVAAACAARTCSKSAAYMAHDAMTA